MGVPVESVTVGKCYVTEIGQVRRVLEIKNAMVKYESRGKTAHGRSWGALTTISIVRFARDVERDGQLLFGENEIVHLSEPVPRHWISPDVSAAAVGTTS